MSINDKVKRVIRDWLNVQRSNLNHMIMIQETDDIQISFFKNELWYRGDASELHQFYGQYSDGVNNSMFWHGQSTSGVDFRKIHTGLPAIIIDKLVDIVVDDMNDIRILSNIKDKKGKSLDDTEATNRWKVIEKEHDFKDTILKEAVKEALLGDCVIKLSYDTDVSKFPLIEVIPGKDVDFEYKRGRLIGIRFYFAKKIDNKMFALEEYYQRDGVTYKLYDENGKDVSVGLIEQLYNLYPFVYEGDFIMATPFIIARSKKFAGRGKSILEGKEGSFDSYDEVWSQWMDALRDGRTRTYIPENLVPRNPENGKLLKPSTFDNRFVQTESDMREGSKSGVQVENPDIHSDKYLSTYITALDLCLQGIISPSTIGIDVKKLDNAESQREKEKTTMYTRSKIISKIEKIVPEIVDKVLKVDDLLNKREPLDYNVTVDFGEYANPSFEAQVETIGKARQQQVMSIETAVEELYGDSWTEEEKNEEVKRLKIELGYEVDEQSVNEFDIQHNDEYKVEDVTS